MSSSMEDLSTIVIEIKKKIVYIGLAFLLSVTVSLQFTGPLIERMKSDLLPEGAKIVYISPLEVMMLKLKIALILGFFITIPFVAFFIIRAVLKKFRIEKPIQINRFWVVVTSFAIIFMFLLGASYAYFIMLPLFLKYLYLNAASSGIVATYSIFKFISFAAAATVIFGLVFELPIVMLFLTKSGIVQYKTFVEYRKHMYVLFLVVGAFITPPDVISQVMVGVPLIIFFEISLFIVRIMDGNSKQKEAKN
ncbi:MAG: twin-arginine translocase subunit TatC [Methanosarcinaceae archaeon]|nr:twin-arginine translocase subunit TatC [Methanosarcinaceae archaeon]MDF1533171.1 twin-arginine translocase subunit TatC [Methanosarcinaceae archaeon]